MILSTTPTLEGKRITEYMGIVSGETIFGANVIKDFKASIRDFWGGRSGSYEKLLREAQEQAIKELTERAEKMGAMAVVGIDFDYETIGAKGSMLLVSVTGTAVKYEAIETL